MIEQTKTKAQMETTARTKNLCGIANTNCNNGGNGNSDAHKIVTAKQW